MRFSPRKVGYGVVAISSLSVLGVVAAFVLRSSPRTIPAPDESQVELTLEHEGATYKVYRGDLFKVGPDRARLTFVDALYDPDFYTKNYEVVGGVPNRRDPETGRLYPTRRHFREGFEGVAGLTDLIGPERGWTSFTLQSPKAPTVPEYNALRRRILDGGEFLDNRIEVSLERAHSGAASLRCYSLAPSPGMVTAKSSLTTSLLHFARGDDVWFSGWFLIPAAGSEPFTLADLESTWIKEHPGMRILLDRAGHLAVELKWAGKPTYRQPSGREATFPVGRWANVRMHLRLSEGADGVVELWQDGGLLVEARGQTLPLANAVYDDLEVGISAHSFGPGAATLFVDDVAISAGPIPPDAAP
jgi:hypothetical protein